MKVDRVVVVQHVEATSGGTERPDRDATRAPADSGSNESSAAGRCGTTRGQNTTSRRAAVATGHSQAEDLPRTRLSRYSRYRNGRLNYVTIRVYMRCSEVIAITRRHVWRYTESGQKQS